MNLALKTSITARAARLTDFALAVQREINVRSGVFEPRTDEERVWKKLGVCEPFELTTVQGEMRG